MFNKTILMGRITHDLQLQTTPNGISVCHFQMAVDRRYQTKGEEKKTDFFRITAWRQTAEFVTRYFGKGRMILVEGELQTSTYTDKNGATVNAVEVVADQVSFTGEKKDDNAAQGYSTSGGSYQQSPQNYQQTQAPTQPAPNYQAQYGAPAPYYQAAPAPNYQATSQNYQQAASNQQAAEMAAIAAKYAGAAPGTTAAVPPPAPAVPVQQPAPPQNAAKGADVYPF